MTRKILKLDIKQDLTKLAKLEKLDSEINKLKDRSSKTELVDKTPLAEIKSKDVIKPEKDKKIQPKEHEKPKSAFKEVYKEMKKLFPGLFVQKKGELVKPLKLNIQKDIEKSGKIKITKRYREFLYEYTKRNTYMKSHVAGAHRYDLNGEIAGVVTKEEEENKLAYKERMKQKKKD